MYTDAIVSVDVNDADDQNPLFGQSRYWAHLPEPAKEVYLMFVTKQMIKYIELTNLFFWRMNSIFS